MPQLSIIVPAYNEEKRLAGSLEGILRYLDSRWPDTEVVVVDDGSKDNTAAIAREFAARDPRVRLLALQPNAGKGHAVRRGMLAGEGDLLLFSDADLATPIEELEKLRAAIERGADIAIASRDIQGSQLEIKQPWYRELAGKTFNLIVQALALPGIHDTQCGFKLFRREAARDIFERCEENGFGMDIEVLFAGRRRGYSIAEIPVRWRHMEGSKVSLVRDSLRMFCSAIRARLRHGGLKRRRKD